MSAMSSRAFDLSSAGHGLRTERQHHIAQMVRDIDPRLSLRRIPENDPAFEYGARLNPQKLFGVWEENVSHELSNWVFTLAEMSIDERVPARLIENDLRRSGASERIAKLEAFERANEASRLKQQAEMMAEREDEMRVIGELAGRKSTIRHRINGEDFIIGDTVRPVRSRL